MMDIRAILPPEEVTEIPVAGRQFGDLTSIARDHGIHLPDCTVAGTAECKCAPLVQNDD